jgi:hypothetical protein
MMPSTSNSVRIEAVYFTATTIEPSQFCLSISSGRTAVTNQSLLGSLPGEL